MKVVDIQQYFKQADEYVESVFEQFKNKFDEFIEKEPSWRVGNGFIRKTPHQLQCFQLLMNHIIKGKL